MSYKQQIYLLHGPDTYRSHHSLKAIENRFLQQAGSMVDFATYDMEETSIDTLKQAFLTIPFLVTHRLFVVKYALSQPKSIQEALAKLLQQLAPSTVVVLYEGKACDKRLSLYQWLAKEATLQEYAVLDEVKAAAWVKALVQSQGIIFSPDALRHFVSLYREDTWQLALESKKLACAVQSQKRNEILLTDIQHLCAQAPAISLFALTDALRDGHLSRLLTLYHELIIKEDPMVLAGTLGGLIRTVAKISICFEQGITRGDEIARRTKLNPYVIKLTLPLARKVSQPALRASYNRLIMFDRSVKEGLAPPALGVLLLIMRLHDTLKSGVA